MKPSIKPPASFLWHDYETFGAQPMIDRPAQFAALRTNADLEPITEPVVWYCAPADDVLPHPMACLITGITPQEARRKGVPETEFAARILSEMMQGGTCGAGYNSIRFDDVITRSLLYRNLRDPYEREYKNGNSRWDLIDLARMCYALRPQGVEWPMHEPGKPSFRLEDLSAANGIAHEGAHDALADVHATIDLAKLLKSAQPRLFDWALGMRDQAFIRELLDPVEPGAVLHTSSRIPAQRGCTTLVLPIAVMPDRPKSVIVFDLMADPAPLIRDSADVISDRVFTAAADMPEGIERLPLKAIHSNHVPMVAPAATLRGVDTDRIGLDPDRCLRHADMLMDALPAVRPKVCQVFQRPPDPVAGDGQDPDQMLYSGFFSPADKHLMKKILAIPPQQLGGHLWSFQDQRLPLMLFRFRARNYPETLTADEAEAWERDRHSRLLHPASPGPLGYPEFKLALAQARDQNRDRTEAQHILDQLESWAVEIGLPELDRMDG
jgi:exodeoxyribonuclease-1